VSDAETPLFLPQRWREIRAELERLDALPAEEITQALHALDAADAELAGAVRALCVESSAETMLGAVARLVPPESSAPDRIGPFRLSRPLGKGGMGSVFLAERQGTDFVQRVALKLLDVAGPNVARLIARERSILAALSHPNITAFVDAGSEHGQAWLAMEYVDGEPLLDHCDRLRLDAATRVRLFDQVCAAVAYAHSQLVVHRDLKPSNVLVTRDGMVKLLDFGIATVLAPTTEEQPATRAFTPEYAAPEQLRGERTTTATDVYALGLMLFELVAGRRLPTAAREDGGTDWTTAQLARFAGAPTDAKRTESARTADKTEARLLHGDLGRILAHALAFDPAQRYATVAQMREDLDRWLDHRPLSIGRRKFSYVAARFVRRHRVAVPLAAAAVLALIGASAFALWQAHEARLMAARAEHAKTFLAALFTEANPFEAKRSGKNVVDLLRAAGQRIDAEFADAPEMQVELRAIVATSLARLGEARPARELAQHNVEQLRLTRGERAPEVGAALASLAQDTEETGDIDAAHARYDEAYALLRDAGDAWTRDRISAMTGLAKMANRRDDYAEAQRWHEAVLHERESLEGPESPDIAMDLMNLSADAGYQEHFAQSETLALRAHTVLEHVLGPGHARSIYVDSNLGVAQIDMGHYAAAIATFEQAVAVARRTLSPKARILGIALGGLGNAQLYAGDDAAAATTLNEAAAILTEINDPGAKGNVELRLGLVQLHTHRAEAAQTLRNARADLAAAASRSAGTAKTALWAQAAYGAALAASGDASEGERQARQARETFKASKFADGYYLAEIDRLLADVLEHEAAMDEALSVRREALAVYLRVLGAEHPRTRSAALEVKAPPSRG
jgi:serine/threonine-protein kinase